MRVPAAQRCIASVTGLSPQTPRSPALVFYAHTASPVSTSHLCFRGSGPLEPCCAWSLAGRVAPLTRLFSNHEAPRGELVPTDGRGGVRHLRRTTATPHAPLAAPPAASPCIRHCVSAPRTRCRLQVCASGAGTPQGGAQVRASRVPTPDEDKEVAHSAFLNAYGQSHNNPNIQGMQEFAGAVSAGCRHGARWQWLAECRGTLRLPPLAANLRASPFSTPATGA